MNPEEQFSIFLEIQKEKEDIERKKALQRKKEIEKQKEEERRREFEKQQEQKQKEKERPRQSGNKPKPFTDSPAPARTLPQSPIQNKEEITTFGPFSAFKNFPSFPRQVLDGQTEDDLNSNPALRGPNLLPTRPTGPPPSNRNQRPAQKSNRPPVNSQPPRNNLPENNGQRPNGPPRPGPTRPSSRDELRFIPSPPLRDPVPPVSVFLAEEEERDPPSVFLPPPNRRPSSNKLKDNFFSVQTQLGQTNTRIPPNDNRRPTPSQPFTFFGQSFPSQNQRPSSGPVSFPGQQSQQGFPRQQPPPGRPAAVNTNIVHDPNSQSSSFLSFNSNNFRQPPVPTGPEQPRSLQSVFGGSSSFQSPFQSNTFFNQGARFESRPNPNSIPPSGAQTAPGSTPVQRRNPPQTVFNLPAGTQRLSQQQNFPGFPQPQFGGFRPIKRHLQVDSDEEEIFAEDLPHHGSRQKKGKNKHANGGNTGSRSKSHVPSPSSERADLASPQQKLLARARAQQAARRRMQAALKNELAKVYFEEFAQKDNDVEYYDYDDYYYYEYLD